MFRAHVSFFSLLCVHSACVHGSFASCFRPWAMRVSALEPNLFVHFACQNNGSGASRAISMTDAHRFKTYADDEIDLRELF